MGLPSVTVIVVALAPSTDLTACLDSVREQDYPWVFENLEFYATRDRHSDPAIGRDRDVLLEAVDTGDAFVRASERQRDFWTGPLADGVDEPGEIRVQ